LSKGSKKREIEILEAIEASLKYAFEIDREFKETLETLRSGRKKLEKLLDKEGEKKWNPSQR